MKMFYEFNLVTKKRAFVFINTECKGAPFINAEKIGKQAAELFQDILEFDDVQVFQNLPKGQIIEQLKFIHAFSDQFEQDNKLSKDKQTQCIAVYWVGSNVSSVNGKRESLL